MHFAVIANIQANLFALEATLQAIDRATPSVESILCAGDVVGRGPHPNEVVDLLREREIASVLGNYDDAVANDRINSGTDFPDLKQEDLDFRALAWTHQRLTPENLEYLEELPRQLRVSPGPAGVRVQKSSGDESASEYRRTYLTRALFGGFARPTRMPGRRILLVHGSPRALNEFVREDTAQSILAVIAREGRADVVISGHAETGFQRDYDGVTYIGVGSVDAPEAEYAVVNLGEGIETEFLRAEYDTAAQTRAILESGLPGELAVADG